MEANIFNIQRFSLHDGSGIRTNVFFQGCNLRCSWCANPESMERDFQGGSVKQYGVDALVFELLKDKAFYDTSNGGVTLTGGEPLLQHEFAAALCDALHAADVRVNMETAANVSADVFQKVAVKCDVILADIKHHDAAKYKDGCGVDGLRTIDNIRWALNSGITTIIRIPVIPGFNDSPSDMRGFAQLLSSFGAKTVHLLPFHQLGESKYADLGKPYAYAGLPQMHPEDLEEHASILRDSGFDVQIGG